MEAAFEIFINGIFGVFMGLAVLYVAIKINKAVNGRVAENREEQA